LSKKPRKNLKENDLNRKEDLLKISSLRREKDLKNSTFKLGKKDHLEKIHLHLSLLQIAVNQSPKTTSIQEFHDNFSGKRNKKKSKEINMTKS
jgi:hypothetical protein